MKDHQIQRLTLGGILSAVILLLTLFVKIPMPVPGGSGYVHLGDGAILLTSVLMGPYAALIAGIGSALADVLSGFAVYALPTFFIKAAMGGFAGFLARKNAPWRNTVVFALAACIMAGGYFLYEGFAFGWPVAIADLVPNLLQGASGVVIGLVLTALPLDRIQRG